MLTKRIFGYGSLTGVAIALASHILPITPQVWAQTAAPGLPQNTQINLVTQISDKLAAQIKTTSCTDFSALLEKAQANSTKPLDQNSLIGQQLLALQKSPQLQAIVVNKLGSPVVTKLIECNMVPVDVLLSP